jgi:hypothetical protein
MSIDTLIVAALSPLVAGRVYPDVAPDTPVLPYIVYQQVGGEGLVFLEGTLPDHEGCRIQLATWGTRRLDVTALAKLAEEALIDAPDLQTEPLGGRVSDHEPETKRYGARQDFMVWAAR